MISLEFKREIIVLMFSLTSLSTLFLPNILTNYFLKLEHLWILRYLFANLVSELLSHLKSYTNVSFLELFEILSGKALKNLPIKQHSRWDLLDGHDFQ